MIREKASLFKFAFPKDRAIRRLSNVIRNEMEFRSGRVELKSMPYALQLDLACMCTLKCPLCFLGQGMKGRPKGIMSMETFCKAIDEFQEYAIIVQLCCRGEPLLNKQLPEMIAYANAARLITVISTNMNIFDEKTAVQLIDSGLKKIVISLDGASEETYKIYRVGGDFKRTLENIELLIRVKRQKKARFPRIVLQFLIFKFNLHEIAKIRELARSLDVELSLQQGCLGGPEYEPYTGTHSEELIDQWIVPPEELLKTVKTSKGRAIFFDYFRNEATLSDERCLFLWKTSFINWDGSVSPCCFVYQTDRDFGNIHQDSFRSIYNNAAFQHSRSLFLESSTHGRKKNTVCDSCRIYKQASKD